jgi:hypothetical protein
MNILSDGHTEIETGYNYHNSGHYQLFSLLSKTQLFEDLILTPSSGGTIELVSRREVRTMDNVQNCNSYINISSSQSYRQH